MQYSSPHWYLFNYMQFHANYTPVPYTDKISLQQSIFLIGSCFTEQIGNKLDNAKFKTLQNPHGILFNPVSIEKALSAYVEQKVYNDSDLFLFNECWNSWEHHSRFSGVKKESVLQNINESVQQASAFLQKAQWLIITLGSAFVYKRREEISDYDAVVANCHKIPNDRFNRVLMSSAAVRECLLSISDKLLTYNPALKIIFTISPVRHLREGFIENNRSKAALIEAVHSCTNNKNILYFPSYELVIDDLRDYRFYAEDLVHPNYAATNYVWEKFIEAAIDIQSKDWMKEIAQIKAACNHKPFNPTSEAHKKFLNSFYEKTKLLQQNCPFIDLNYEMNYFKSAASGN